MKITRIAICGGPGSGKTSVLNELERRAGEKAQKDTALVFLPEVATVFFTDRAKEINGCDGKKLARQHYILRTEVLMEQTAIKAAQASGADHAVIISDRGICDINSYLDKAEAEICLYGTKIEGKLEEHYDGVIFLENAGYVDLDSKDTVRLEADMDEVKSISESTRRAWEKCRGFVSVPQFESVDKKADNVAELINAITGKNLI